MRNLPIAMTVLFLAACGGQPTKPVAAVAPAAAPAAATAGAAATAPAAPKVVAGTAAEQAKAPPGYKAVKRDGQMFYCKETSQIGTRFTKVRCMTPEEFAEYERNADQVRQEMQRRGNVCNSPTGICGG